MSKLEYYNRPLVAFDATNKDHRRYFYEFKKRNTWGNCPVRFILPDSTGNDLVQLITKELLSWYVSKEFTTKQKI